MRLGTIANNLIERVALAAGLVPTPLLDTVVANLLSHSVLVATRVGVFEALRAGPRSAAGVAQACGTDAAATAKLLTALVGCGYLRCARDQFSLAPLARKWLLADSPASLRDAILYQVVDTRYIEHFEAFVRTGVALDIHEHMSAEEWGLYQRAMRSGANLSVKEVVLRTPVPRHARRLLDIGGSHGYYSVAFCRKHPQLHAVILDLPEAAQSAAALLAREGMGERISYQVGDARCTDLGNGSYDVIFIANLVHHFDAVTNQDLMARAARALRPGGLLVIAELVRPRTPSRAGQIGALADLYFAATSLAGTWSSEEMAAWQRDAGLAVRRPIRLVTAPGGALHVARKREEAG